MATKCSLPVLALPGLSPDSLGNYLASLGLLRVLTRKWPSTRIAWRDGVLQVVGGPPTLEELLDELVRIANKREWTQYDKSWSNAQKKSTKDKSGAPLALWQAEAPEDQLLLFAAHVVPHARVRFFNPLLGSGGNAGQRNFASGWNKAVQALQSPPKSTTGRRKRRAPANANGAGSPDERKEALRALLLGNPVTWLVTKLAAGSWFSEATKLYNSGQSPAREGLLCPWAMALACEGLQFLAGGASRRLGAHSGRAVGAFPFVTQETAPATAAQAGRILGEFWAPLWARPMSLAEVSTLFFRGRAELQRRGALTPAEFATAIRARGVDAGISEFRRFTLGHTTSSNTFEPRLEARFLPELSSDGTAAVVSTLERVTVLLSHRGFPRDRKEGKRWHFVGLRGPIEQALLDLAAEPNSSEAGIALLDSVIRALDRIDRNRSFREQNVRWEPLPLDWLPSLFADGQPGAEARLALSIVSAFPETLPFAAFRFGVEWARGQSGKYHYDWKTEPRWFEHANVAPARWVWGPGELASVLATVLSRRLLEEAKLDATQTERPCGRAPIPATISQIQQWLAGHLDESLLSAWLSRLALFDWRRIPQEVTALVPRGDSAFPADGEVALLGLFQPLIDHRPLVISPSSSDLVSAETASRTAKVARSLVTLIRAGNLDAALALASSRYAKARERLATLHVSFATHAPDRLAAALLFPLSGNDRKALFNRWLRPRRTPHRSETHD